MNYVVYDTGTGEIVKWGSCHKDCAHLQAGPGQALIEGIGTSRQHRVDVETASIVQLPQKPSDHHKFDYATKAWLDARTPETEWVEVRKKRDAVLRDTDFTQLSDSPKNKQAWAVYRQALRDITQQADPFNVVWPTPPTN